MIRIVKRGKYRLFISREKERILLLDGKSSYTWVKRPDVGDILIPTSTKAQSFTQSFGPYRFYEVIQEQSFSDFWHLELLIDRGKWQCFLLTTGFPNRRKKINKIIPTREIISL